MKLNRTLSTLLLQAVKMSGSYNPDQTLHFVEEQLTLAEVKEARAFLTWVHANSRFFGHGNLPAVWNDWQITQTGGAKPKVTKSIGHDQCRVSAKFPSGGVFRLTVTRAGETLTLGGSSDPYLADQQQRTVADWILPVTPEETIGQRVERVAAFLSDCLSVDHLCRKIRIANETQKTKVEAQAV